ncbi:SDR family NAD(P)-dependent oxidoreductase [Candidatus Poriferisodalis sp.]|uniref:SDR family NAD(P)-dependent oxidoreductase n=1 Tax=Candidatus Poriferisodalis sp. TaxID=3101277 RepID=UPI003B02AE70
MRRRRRSFPDSYGEWAVVAGASEGFGAAFAAELAARGMNSVLLARRGDVLAEVRARLQSTHPVEVRCVELDLADDAIATALADAAAGLDIGIVVYNAASVPIGPFLSNTDEAVQHAVDVNVRGPLRAVQTLAPAMCERGRGAVVLVSSLSGLQGTPHVAVYAATKAFNTHLAESLWYELRPFGIDVVACCAGAMPTPGYARTFGRDVPGMLAPEEAARQTLDRLDRGPRVVPGRVNRLAAQLMGRAVPRKAAIRFIARDTKHLT